MEIEQNYKRILGKIENSKKCSNREADDIIFIGVSKTQPIELLKEAYNCGLRVFGENKVQELIEKYPLLDGVKWHFIGHLQKNKVKYIVDKVEMIHSLDSIELAEEINKRASKINRVVPVLIQINIGKEETKSGIFEEEVDDFCKAISQYANIEVAGVMAIPPAGVETDITREYFRNVKEIFNIMKNFHYNNFNIRYLSMGMTNDYEIAIEEGSNIIRVGTGLFGKRNYIGG